MGKPYSWSFRQKIKGSWGWDSNIGGNSSSPFMDFLPLTWSEFPKDKSQLAGGLGTIPHCSAEAAVSLWPQWYPFPPPTPVSFLQGIWHLFLCVWWPPSVIKQVKGHQSRN